MLQCKRLKHLIYSMRVSIMTVDQSDAKVTLVGTQLYDKTEKCLTCIHSDLDLK